MPASSTQKPLNLTQTAATMRKVIMGGSLMIILLVVGRMFWASFSAYWTAQNPPPPPPPTVGFGPLPRIQFPPQTDKPLSYKLETVTGSVPAFVEDRMKVFFVPSAQPSLRTIERAKMNASNLGYIFEPEVLDTRTYRWTLNAPILSVLEMDILTGNFTITSDWASHPELLNLPQPVSPEAAITKVKTLVSGTGKLTSDFSPGIDRTTLVKAVGNRFEEEIALADADFVQVDAFRALIDGKYTSVSVDKNQGPIHAVVAPDGTILEMSVRTSAIEYIPGETYPLRSAGEAWQQLSSGEGYVINKGTSDTAVVRTVYLAYLETLDDQQFYQPVYVFEGDGGFMGVVEAIHPAWLVRAVDTPR